MNWLTAAGLGVFAAAVVAVLSVPLWPTPTYVGESGVHVGEGGTVSVFVHGCGVEYEKVTVTSGREVAAVYEAESVRGEQVFALGAAAPQGWTLTSDAAVDPAQSVGVQVTVTDPARGVRFRDSLVERAWLDDPEFVVLGTYDSAVAHLFARPEEWGEVC